MNILSIEAKLGVNKYRIDEENAHIVILEQPNRQQFQTLVKVCPAGLYKWNEKGEVCFDYAGCLECGACRVLGGETVLAKWSYPQGAFGIHYRFG